MSGQDVHTYVLILLSVITAFFLERIITILNYLYAHWFKDQVLSPQMGDTIRGAIFFFVILVLVFLAFILTSS